MEIMIVHFLVLLSWFSVAHCIPLHLDHITENAQDDASATRRYLWNARFRNKHGSDTGDDNNDNQVNGEGPYPDVPTQTPAAQNYSSVGPDIVGKLGLLPSSGDYPILMGGSFPGAAVPSSLVLTNVDGKSVTVTVQEILATTGDLFADQVYQDAVEKFGSEVVQGGEIDISPSAAANLTSSGYNVVVARVLLPDGSEAIILADKGPDIEGTAVVFIAYDWALEAPTSRLLQSRPSPFSVCIFSPPPEPTCGPDATPYRDQQCIDDAKDTFVAAFNLAYNIYDEVIIAARVASIASEVAANVLSAREIAQGINACRLFFLFPPFAFAACTLAVIAYAAVRLVAIQKLIEEALREEEELKQAVRNAAISAGCTRLKAAVQNFCVGCEPIDDFCIGREIPDPPAECWGGGTMTCCSDDCHCQRTQFCNDGACDDYNVGRR